MANDSEYSPGHASQIMAQIPVMKEAIVRPECPPPRALNTTPPAEIQGDITVKSRAYQLEMLEESLKRNVIVAMDTGSGKTHVAVLRIKKELEMAPAYKLIWFLTPTVALCSQQLHVLQSQISSVQIKSFTSADNVDRWTEKADWDAVLTNVKVVVSTYAVLYEALCHGFVDMKLLALIVFDEAHHCIGSSPGSKIMHDFYWRQKRDGHPVPHILGLTASPVMGSKLKDLETLELTLDSICRSPRLQKDELLLHANRPKLTTVSFEANNIITNLRSRTQVMESLVAVHKDLKICEDPEILRLKTRNDEASRNKLERALKTHKTFIQDQMNSFIRRSGEAYRSLGAWAADGYISQVTLSFIQSADLKDIRFLEWGDSEKQYLANALRLVDAAPQTLSVLSEGTISHKARALITFLRSCEEDITGIIFVKERAIAYMLHRLLSVHPETCHRLRFEILVGASQRPRGKRDICELPNSGNGLENFRSGKINFLIGTSVLEEGIDVPKCKIVICFDEPATLKSYIQCRGRARMAESELVMLRDTKSTTQTRKWAELELEMKRQYEEQERNVQKLAEIYPGETEQSLNRQFRVQGTGALLNMENAKGHLDCFCSRLSSHSSVEMRPEYIIIEEGGEEGQRGDQPLLRAKVILPGTLDFSLRVTESRLSWRSEKNATKDAAFEAYVALYHAGLINDNLLPLSFAESSKYMEKQDSIVEVHEQFNPWPRVAQAWENRERLQRRDLTLKDQYGLTKCKVEMLIPAHVPTMEPIRIHWDALTEWRIEIGSPTNVQHSNITADDTKTLLSLAYGHRWEVDTMRQVVLFKVMDMDISQTQVKSVLLTPQGCTDDSVGLLRDPQNHGHPYLFHSWQSTKPSIQSIQVPHKDYESFPDDQTFVALKKWSRRSDFLHPAAPDPASKQREYFSVLPQSQLEMDIVPTSYSQFGLLIPSILHKVNVQLVVEELCTTVLYDTGVLDRRLIRTAISASAAQEQDNYQKLEFLGDSILKFLVSVFLTSAKPHFPEGYLSLNKDAIVSNSRLCKAAIDRSLDKFILTKIFTGNKWRPLYVDKLLEGQEEGTREMPSKTIADVVESLIGAGWRMEGLQKSLLIANVFLPELELPSLEVGRGRLFDLAPLDVQLPANLDQLEKLAQYSFKKKSLLVQAMSHRSDTTAIASYERLEFLGDAILEFIIVTELSAYEDKLSHSLMHLYKTALVNGDYLGFIALEWNITQKKTELKENPSSGAMEKVESQFALPLWRFMRHASTSVGKEQHYVGRRHTLLRHDILCAIESGTEYPWTLLAKVHINKFYSDLVESLLGAVWIDSGSIDACKELLDRMGILRYLRRIVRDRVHVLHPREELGILADGKEVKYEVEEEKTKDGIAEWKCTVFVGETKVAEATQGVSSDEVRTRAAETAVSSLRSANGRLGAPIAYGKRVSRYGSERRHDMEIREKAVEGVVT